uniref:Uncharacterized protein n=1 Tax=Branchiostoma floridae TaxID=7739 RepID=C3ZPU7_BRAFL|eukprot:XP_002589315.1 hypothetical protein BRAFLDRAFT_77768 [Branchiostoma floridae]
MADFAPLLNPPVLQLENQTQQVGVAGQAVHSFMLECCQTIAVAGFGRWEDRPASGQPRRPRLMVSVRCFPKDRRCSREESKYTSYASDDQSPSSLIVLESAPQRQAKVAPPRRKLCPEYCAEGRPAASSKVLRWDTKVACVSDTSPPPLAGTRNAGWERPWEEPGGRNTRRTGGRSATASEDCCMSRWRKLTFWRRPLVGPGDTVETQDLKNHRCVSNSKFEGVTGTSLTHMPSVRRRKAWRCDGDVFQRLRWSANLLSMPGRCTARSSNCPFAAQSHRLRRQPAP